MNLLQMIRKIEGKEGVVVEMKRRKSQEDRLLEKFQKHGVLTNVEMAKIALRYSARIGQLRKKYDIPAPEHVKPGVTRYYFLGEK